MNGRDVAIAVGGLLLGFAGLCIVGMYGAMPPSAGPHEPIDPAPVSRAAPTPPPAITPAPVRPAPLPVAPTDPMEAIGAHPLLDEVDDTGLAITPTKMRAAQLHLLPVTTDPPLPSDEATLVATLTELAPDAARCVPNTDDDALALRRVPLLDGSGSVLEVASLPQGHGDATTLACLTEVLRTVRFEPSPPTQVELPLP